MKQTAAILALLSTSALVNGRVMSKQNLVQLTAQKTSPGLDTSIEWQPNQAANAPSTSDAFNNVYSVESDHWSFSDFASGTVTDVYSTYVSMTQGDGSIISYDFVGNNNYTDAAGNHWWSEADGTEHYKAVNGDSVYTSADGSVQEYLQFQPESSTYDFYTISGNGTQYWYQDYNVNTASHEDLWFWDEPDKEWCYYFADT
jgi:hypothetical protein